MAYDPNNIFARILRGEIPCRKVAENDHALAFEDINPLTPVHVLIIPKGPYETSDAFFAEAGEAEIAGFLRLVGEVAGKTGVAATGYRLISNTGAHGHQEVPHYHMHLLGGRPVGPMVKRA